MVKSNFVLEAILIPDEVNVYHLDLIKHRDLSKEIAEKWGIRHESPQVLLIQDQVCQYDASHNHIHVADIVTQIKG